MNPLNPVNSQDPFVDSSSKDEASRIQEAIQSVYQENKTQRSLKPFFKPVIFEFLMTFQGRVEEFFLMIKGVFESLRIGPRDCVSEIDMIPEVISRYREQPVRSIEILKEFAQNSEHCTLIEEKLKNEFKGIKIGEQKSANLLEQNTLEEVLKIATELQFHEIRYEILEYLGKVVVATYKPDSETQDQLEFEFDDSSETPENERYPLIMDPSFIELFEKVYQKGAQTDEEQELFLDLEEQCTEALVQIEDLSTLITEGDSPENILMRFAIEIQTMDYAEELFVFSALTNLLRETHGSLDPYCWQLRNASLRSFSLKCHLNLTNQIRNQVISKIESAATFDFTIQEHSLLKEQFLTCWEAMNKLLGETIVPEFKMDKEDDRLITKLSGFTDEDFFEIKDFLNDQFEGNRESFLDWLEDPGAVVLGSDLNTIFVQYQSYLQQ